MKVILNIIVCISMLTAVSCRDGVKRLPGKKPEGIVTLAPSITKQLILLGVRDQIVGNTSYCPSRDLKNSKEIASAMTVNVEKIAILRPAMVLCTTLTKADVRNKLTELGIKVKCFQSPVSFDQICKQFIELGQVVGKKALAEDIIARQRKRVKVLQEGILDKSCPKIFIEIGANPLFAVTPQYFMHDFIRLSNGKNIAANLTNGRISREKVLIENPDVIVIVTMGMTGEEERLQWLKYKSLSATKTNRIYIIKSNMACSPTPVSFVDVLEDLIESIYKKKE